MVGVCSIVLGWYFNVRYTHLYGHRANYVNYTKMLFTNWAADSAAQDYIIVNVVLLPLWTIVEGSRRGLRWAWIFFVMSLFTSLAFAMAMFLALHGAPAPLQPVARPLQHGVAAVVAGDEGDAGPAVAPGTAEVQAVDGNRVVRPAPRARGGTDP